MRVNQKILRADSSYVALDKYFAEAETKRLLLVCGKSFSSLKISRYFDTLEARVGITVVKFSEFRPNPQYESVVDGVKVFLKNDCDSIVAVGGGSAMDVAKCIRLYANMNPQKNYLEQSVAPQDIPLLAVPTTAGSGSEATRYAVIYYKGEKQSITHENCIPSAVLLDPSALCHLPEYQRKCTMLDALCHALESYWSIKSTDESKEYSRAALGMILEHMELYLDNDEAGNAAMLEAAHLAGQAINIAQTTAGHAMCYKLTSLYGIAHGHAAALCVAQLWPYMLTHTEKCSDARGKEYMEEMFAGLGRDMGCESAEQGTERFRVFLDSLCLPRVLVKEEDITMLVSSVNPVRRKNNPVWLDEETLADLYRGIQTGRIVEMV